MNPPFYEKVLDLALLITNSDDSEERWQTYQKLQSICNTHEDSELDHPFQWETLGDFTPDNGVAISIYSKALRVATTLKLVEYVASINLAIAERFCENENNAMAGAYAVKADKAARQLDDLEIRQEISELLLKIAANKNNQSGQKIIG